MKLIINKEKKDHSVPIRMTKTEKALLEARAKIYGVSLSSFLIYCGTNYVPGENELEESYDAKKKGRS